MPEPQIDQFPLRGARVEVKRRSKLDVSEGETARAP